MNTYTTAKEIGAAIQRRESAFIVEGDVANKIIRIKLVGPLAWAVCGVSLGGAIALYLATPVAAVTTAPVAGAGGTLSFTGASALAGTAAATGLGTATITAIILGIAGGGIGAVTTLRSKYKIAEKSKGRIVLKSK